MTDWKTLGQRSERVATRRQSESLPNNGIDAIASGVSALVVPHSRLAVLSAWELR